MSEDIKNVPGDELVTVTNITRSPIGYAALLREGPQ